MINYRINNLKFPIEQDEKSVINEIAKSLPQEISNLRLVKKSLDARNKNNLYFIYAAEFTSPKPIADHKLLELEVEDALDFTKYRTKINKETKKSMQVALPLLQRRGAYTDVRDPTKTGLHLRANSQNFTPNNENSPFERQGGKSCEGAEDNSQNFTPNNENSPFERQGGKSCEVAEDVLQGRGAYIDVRDPTKTGLHLRANSQYFPIVIGAGPAGMMASLCFAEAGLNPIVIERGGSVEERQIAVQKFWKMGELDEGSNVQFGEGGAGTFSDGKLMTGIKKDQYTAKVLKEFADAGAPKEILYLAKPHIGTDKLVTMTKNLRKKIISLGGEYRFNEQLVDICPEGDKVRCIIKRKDTTSYEIVTDTLVLALGHSARDTFKMLYEKGLKMSQKPFSVGVRIEHKQKDINLAQYGKKYCNSPYLGAADYKLASHHEDNRSLYTFCMCPGGVVVGATSLKGHVVTNGMSEFARDKENANAALLVNVDERDFGSDHPLAGIEFQEKLEKKAFELGGKSYAAPVQTVGDFLKGKETTKLGKVKPSYKPATTPSDFKKLFPKPIYETLQKGIKEMDKKLKGFASSDAVLTAVESRSSSPVRIFRDENNQSNICGIYPIGEGAGYAGGITSAAADGVKTAHKIILQKLGKLK